MMREKNNLIRLYLSNINIYKKSKEKGVNKMLGKTKGQGGITLVALVVTIVVLLILAGITISLVFAQNGVVQKAQEAAKGSDRGVIADNIQGYILGKQMEVMQTATATTDLVGDMKTNFANVGITVSGSGTIIVNADTSVTITGTVTFALNGQSYDLSDGGYNTGYPDLQ